MGTDDLALPCSRPRERAAVGPRDGRALALAARMALGAWLPGFTG